ncbi:hypothetical protein TNCV_1326591 [Trichonephila clavipes]|nr:hypothetical protein TNCV_1326591 [Trichonephila clavipes]
MAPIDNTQSTEEQVLDVSDIVNKITKKTIDNIVNVAHEWKAEYHKVKSTLYAHYKKVEVQDIKVEDVHLYYKNLIFKTLPSLSKNRTKRTVGPNSMSRATNLILIRSCNAINWLDMRKSLLIADRRPMDNPQDLDMIAIQRLIEQYPILLPGDNRIPEWWESPCSHGSLGGRSRIFSYGRGAAPA